jgi:hypothetical protein
LKEEIPKESGSIYREIFPAPLIYRRAAAFIPVARNAGKYAGNRKFLKYR